MESQDLFIEVLNKINKNLRRTLGQYVFDVTLDSSPNLSITIFYQNSLTLSVAIFKDIQVSTVEKAETRECKKNFTYTLNEPDEKFNRFMKFIESVRDDLSKIEYDDIDLFYIYIIFPLIYPKAIKIGEDYLVEAIIDECIICYNYRSKPSILSFITTLYSNLRDIYPHYAKKIISTLTIYNNDNHNLKMRVTEKGHLESFYNDHIKKSIIFNIVDFKFEVNDFLYSPLELSFIFIIVILYLSLFYVYNNKDVLISLVLILLIFWFIMILMGPKAVPLVIKRSSVELFIPLTKFTSYSEPTQSIELTEHTKPNFLKKLEKKLFKLLLIPTSDELNEFIKNHYPRKYSLISESQGRVLYSDWNGEALINFKWNCFAKFYYYCKWSIFITFLFIFSFSNTYRTKFLVADVILGFFLLLFEFRKFLFNTKKYIWTEINYISLGAYVFPTASSVLYLIKFSPPAWMLSVSFLLLDAKMIFFLLPFELFGPYLAIIRYVAKHVFSFLLILLLLILTFAHAFFILLRPSNPFDPSTPVFDNDPNNPWNMASTYNNISSDKNVSEDPSLIQLPNMNTNLYSYYNTSVLAVYQLMTGNTDSLSPWELNQNPQLVIMWVAYSFLIVIYLLNLFIGLLNNAIQDTSSREFFLYQKAEIIAEIELFWLLPRQRRWKEWFPDHIWYNVYVDDLRKKIQEIRDRDLYKGDKPIIHPEILKLIRMQEQDDEKGEKP